MSTALFTSSSSLQRRSTTSHSHHSEGYYSDTEGIPAVKLDSNNKNKDLRLKSFQIEGHFDELNKTLDHIDKLSMKSASLFKTQNKFDDNLAALIKEKQDSASKASRLKKYKTDSVVKSKKISTKKALKSNFNLTLKSSQSKGEKSANNLTIKSAHSNGDKSVNSEAFKFKPKHKDSELSLTLHFGKENLLASGVGESYNKYDKALGSSSNQFAFVLDFVNYFASNQEIMNQEGLFMVNGDAKRVKFVVDVIEKFYEQNDLKSVSAKTLRKRFTEGMKFEKSIKDEQTIFRNKIFFNITKKYEKGIKKSGKFGHVLKRFQSAKTHQESTKDADANNSAPFDYMPKFEELMKYMSDKNFSTNEICSALKELLMKKKFSGEPLIPFKNSTNFLKIFELAKDKAFMNLDIFLCNEIRRMVYPNNYYFCLLINFFRELLTEKFEANLLTGRNLSIAFGNILFRNSNENLYDEERHLDDRIRLLNFFIEFDFKLPYSRNSGTDAVTDIKQSSVVVTRFPNFDFGGLVNLRKYDYTFLMGQHTGVHQPVYGVVHDCVSFLTSKRKYLHISNFVDAKVSKLSSGHQEALESIKLKFKTSFFDLGPYNVLQEFHVKDPKFVVLILQEFLKARPILVKNSAYEKSLKYIYHHWKNKEISGKASKLAVNLFVLDKIGKLPRASLSMILDLISMVLCNSELGSAKTDILQLAKVFKKLLFQYDYADPAENVLAEELFCFLVFRYNCIKTLLLNESESPMVKNMLSQQVIFDSKLLNPPLEYINVKRNVTFVDV